MTRHLAIGMAAAALLAGGLVRPGLISVEPTDEDDFGWPGWPDVEPLPKKKIVRNMGCVHDYPPSPFESRQVRRARERRLAKLNKRK